MLQVADHFAKMILSREGEQSRAWLEGLPASIDRLVGLWDLEIEGEPLYGMCAVVLRGRVRGGERIALKVSWIDNETRFEPLALGAWAGRGAVSLLGVEEASGAMLLERLDERRTLLEVPIETALDVAAGLLKDLRVPAIPDLRRAGDIASRWGNEFHSEWHALGKPCDEALVRSAVELCHELAEPVPVASTLHGDFHYANMLGRGDTDWATIDPKPLTGDPAYEVVPLLRNRWSDIRGGEATVSTIDGRMRRFADLAELDLAATLKWCLVRSVDDAMWFHDNGYARNAEISWDIAKTMYEVQ